MTARTYQPVRRESLDVDDPRAQVFRPIQGGIKFVDVYLEVFDEWADTIKQKGAQHELSANCRRVLEKILLRCTDFKTGVCEPCIDTLQRLTRFARATVVRCLSMLRRQGFIDWIRRTMPTGNEPGEGPQVKQVSNAYYFDLTRLHTRVKMAIRQKLRKKQVVLQEECAPRVSFFKKARARLARSTNERRGNRAAALANASSLEEKAAINYPGDLQKQREWLAMFEAPGGEGASSGNSLNPPSSIKG